jgi:hypothetical protein
MFTRFRYFSRLCLDAGMGNPFTYHPDWTNGCATMRKGLQGNNNASHEFHNSDILTQEKEDLNACMIHLPAMRTATSSWLQLFIESGTNLTRVFEHLGQLREDLFVHGRIIIEEPLNFCLLLLD